jgi:cold shock CspA family protein
MSCTATIKWFNAKKGFGFAGPEGGGDDIFVHVANIKKDDEGNAPYLDEGDTIYCTPRAFDSAARRLRGRF